MISIYNLIKNTLGEKTTLQVELRGLSTDDKPTILNGEDIENGSVFIEIDTGDVYLYDSVSKEWNNITSDETEETQETEEVI